MTEPRLTISPGWTWIRFGDLADQINDRVDDPAKAGVDRYVGLEHLDSRSLRISRWGQPTDVSATKLRFRPGDIIFGRRRAYQRKLAVAEFDGICSAHAMVLRAKPVHVLPEFLPHLMQSDAFMDRAVQISVGSLSPTINWTVLREERFAVPPVGHQRSMTKLLDVAQSQRRALAECEHLATELLASLAEAFIAAHPTKIPLRTIVSRLEAGISPPSSGVPAGEGVGVLKVSAVGDWDFAPNENKGVDAAVYDQTLSVNAGDVLFTRANADPSGVGRSCLVTRNYPNLMLCDKTWRVHLAPELQGYGAALVAVSKARPFRDHVQRSFGGTEAKNISQALLLAAPVPSARPSAWSKFNSSVQCVLDARAAIRTRAQQSDIETLIWEEAIRKGAQ